MDQAIIIQDEIRNKLAELTKINPNFEPSSQEINVLLYKLRANDLESYKSQELQQTAQDKFDTIVELLSDCVRTGQVSNIQAYGLITRIGDMRQADFDYLTNDYLPRMAEHFKGIHESVTQIEKTLDRASGREVSEVEEKSKFQKIIGNIFGLRNSQEKENTKKLKPK
jgi:hypothetical protein